jgi:hypothetical protein
MKDEELEKLGILADKSTLHPNRYWCNTTQTQINIHKMTSAEDIMTMIFKEGYGQGIETGKAQRSQEFKNLINNTEPF